MQLWGEAINSTSQVLPLLKYKRKEIFANCCFLLDLRVPIHCQPTNTIGSLLAQLINLICENAFFMNWAFSGELFTIDYTLTREILEQDQLAWWTKAMTQMWVNVLLSYDSYCILLFQVLLNMLGVICPYCEVALLLFQNCHNCNQKNPDTVRSKLFSVSKLSSVIIVFFCR